MAEDADDLAFPNLKVDAVQHGHPAIAGAQSRNLKQDLLRHGQAALPR